MQIYIDHIRQIQNGEVSIHQTKYKVVSSKADIDTKSYKRTCKEDKEVN